MSVKNWPAMSGTEGCWNATAIDRAPAGEYYLFEGVLHRFMPGPPVELTDGYRAWIKNADDRFALGPLLELSKPKPLLNRVVSWVLFGHYGMPIMWYVVVLLLAGFMLLIGLASCAPTRPYPHDARCTVDGIHAHGDSTQSKEK